MVMISGGCATLPRTATKQQSLDEWRLLTSPTSPPPDVPVYAFPRFWPFGSSVVVAEDDPLDYAYDKSITPRPYEPRLAATLVIRSAFVP